MVDVLLAVYNGEKYLKEQIESILNQTFQDFNIIIRDDGSNDKSVEIMGYYRDKYPEKIRIVSGAPTGSAKQNFNELLKNTTSDYIMFCDQDDVWLPQKIEKTLAKIKSIDANGKTPTLVHTDLNVVDQNLNVISQSFFDFQQLNQQKMSLPALLVQNYVTGCTVMINRALANKCGEIPPECMMHDWWLALVAILFGNLVCINEPTMLYRQHEGNQVGAKASYGLAFIKRKLATLDKVRENYNATYVQADALIKSYSGDLSKEQEEILKIYCQIPKMNKFQKIRTVQNFGFKKCTKLRVIGQYFLM